MFSCLCRAFGLGFGALGLCSTWPRKHRKHRPCHALATWTPENTAPAVLWPLGRSKGLLEAPLGAPGALEWAARAPTWCPQNARRGCTTPRSMPPGHSKGLLEPPLSAPRALSGAAQACSVPQAAPSGCSRLFSVPPLRSEHHFAHLLGAADGRSHLTLEEAFGNAARRICPRLHLRSVTLCSATLCCVHGYARVHTSIYIYIYMYMGMCRFIVPAPNGARRI